MKPKAQHIPGALLLALGATPLIAGVTIPHTFQSGETAVAEEVNENFEALRNRIEELENELDNVLELNEHVEVINVHPTDPNAQTVRFSGVDVQIVNGEGETATVNGVGNLIVGYNEERSGYLVARVCSDGRYDNETECTSNGGTWAHNHKSGSHNIVGGSGNAYSSYGGLVVGLQNTINRAYASISAGQRNVASGEVSSVSGGHSNTAEGPASSISGGGDNTTEGWGSSILGGEDQTASDEYETIPN